VEQWFALGNYSDNDDDNERKYILTDIKMITHRWQPVEGQIDREHRHSLPLRISVQAAVGKLSEHTRPMGKVRSRRGLQRT
jgi:hypothetical protein